jgi:hypothetical protein
MLETLREAYAAKDRAYKMLAKVSEASKQPLKTTKSAENFLRPKPRRL